jgi:conjugative transfer signal peptidase TraF
MTVWRKIVLATCGAAVATLSVIRGAQPLYIWNASDSVPIGLYRVQATEKRFVTELVAVRPPGPLAQYLDLNGYLPNGVPMLKHVLALPGQTVCRSGLTISIDRREIGNAMERDASGRRLPAWQGCRIIAADELFLMNPQSGRSLDGRYFGPIAISAVIGRALPLWTGAK